ncbi:MAG: hypothetical protein K6U87_06165 [Firmicutes bacterium]|nr:hypothetical protein [Bacillota bacterium]
MHPSTHLPRCPLCGHVMLTGPGCTAAQMRVRTPAGLWVRMPRIPFGREEGRLAVPGPDGRCADCGAPRGGFHHQFCDQEECPQCRGQAISCRCMAEPVP